VREKKTRHEKTHPWQQMDPMTRILMSFQPSFELDKKIEIIWTDDRLQGGQIGRIFAYWAIFF
jgi:PIN domain nuclease of toxin-antitoxin system